MLFLYVRPEIYHPASFRSHLAMDILAFGYVLPTTGRTGDFHSLERASAKRTMKNEPPGLKCPRGFYLLYSFYVFQTVSCDIELQFQLPAILQSGIYHFDLLPFFRYLIYYISLTLSISRYVIEY